MKGNKEARPLVVQRGAFREIAGARCWVVDGYIERAEWMEWREWRLIRHYWFAAK